MIEDSTIVQMIAEEPVVIIGSYEALFKQIEYAEDALKNQITGKVLVEFTVDAAGNVSNAVVMDGLGDGCDEEALRAIQLARFENRIRQDHEMRLRVPFKM